MHLSDYFSKVISFGLRLPVVQLCNWFRFRFSLSLSREGAIFRDEIENYFSCSHLARRDRDYHMTILVFRDENEITYCYSRVSRQDRDFKKSFLMVEREKMKLILTRIPGIENSRWALPDAFLVHVGYLMPLLPVWESLEWVIILIFNLSCQFLVVNLMIRSFFSSLASLVIFLEVNYMKS